MRKREKERASNLAMTSDAGLHQSFMLATAAFSASALRTRLLRLLSEGEVDAFGHRVTELAADPTFPVLDAWDGRPFEWW